MTISPTTIATLNSLDAVEWLTACGKQDTKSASVVESWDAAIASCSTLEWENLRLEAANQFRSRLMERSLSRYMLWNDVVGVVKPFAMALVSDKIDATVAKHSLPQEVVHCVQWDILHLCMEAEYADVFGPAFYASLSYWYSKGHFPCGWSGDFPKGNIIVY